MGTRLGLKNFSVVTLLHDWQMILRRAMNYRTMQLSERTPGETVGLLRRDGTLSYRAWCGFIDVHDARLIAGAIPVKMAIAAFALSDEPGARWTALPSNRFLQGCLTADGVRCVLRDGRPRMVSTQLTIQA